jgi:hypothetical protein
MDVVQFRPGKIVSAEFELEPEAVLACLLTDRTSNADRWIAPRSAR